MLASLGSCYSGLDGRFGEVKEMWSNQQEVRNDQKFGSDVKEIPGRLTRTGTGSMPGPHFGGNLSPKKAMEGVPHTQKAFRIENL